LDMSHVEYFDLSSVLANTAVTIFRVAETNHSQYSKWLIPKSQSFTLKE
jgi:hypothetical protein